MRNLESHHTRREVLAGAAAVSTAALLGCERETSSASGEPAEEDSNEPMIDGGYPVVSGRWSADRANGWYADLPWLVGCNYYPATAINAIDMWQASTFDPGTIDKELALAASIGMNTVRVYLHDLVWADDEQGLYGRMDSFMDICGKHGIRPFYVFFDDCHYPEPKLGVQPGPVRGVHNSGWVNSPARELALRFAEGNETPEEFARLRGYVRDTMRRFKDDDRVLMWELYNEPGRGTGSLTGTAKERRRMIGDRTNRLLHQSWIWAREAQASQPVSATSEGSVGEGNIAISRANSDVHSIHNYTSAEKLEALIAEYKLDGRPLLMTEWLARTNGSTVGDCLPVLKEHGVAAINWGFVSGKTGTVWPWTSRLDPAGGLVDVDARRESGDVVGPGDPFPEPEVWFHDLFRVDGTSFDQEEIDLFRELTGVA